jgi:tRNA A-37 threonylcarbamoyl transferase component Bud32
MRKQKRIEGSMKKHSRTGGKQFRIRTRQYVAVFDGGFCTKRELSEFIAQVDARMAAGQIIKDGPASCVSHLTWNGIHIVVKRYNHQGFIHSLRHTLKGSRSRRAWLHAHRLDALDIPTPSPLACIECRKGWLIWKSYVVTEYVDGLKLNSFLLDKSIDTSRHLAVIRDVVTLLDRLWEHHITHGDLKHTNLLITKDGPILTDLDGMKVHCWGPSYRSHRAKDVKRFLRAVTAWPVIHDCAQKLISEATAPARSLVDDFDDVKVGDWVIRVHQDFPKESIARLLSACRSCGDVSGDSTRVPSSEHSHVFKCRISSKDGNLGIYTKQFLFRSWLDFAKHLFRAGRARRAFGASLMLQEHGFDTPAVLGLFERRLGPFTVDGMLATREVKNATPMTELLWNFDRRSDADVLSDKRTLIKEFARTVGHMHARGIFHGDLRIGNVLVVHERPSWRFYFVDNERTRKFCRLPARLRLKNLVQINMCTHGISNTDRLRFFKAYLRVNPDIRERPTAWIRRIARTTNRRVRGKPWADEWTSSKSSSRTPGEG